MLSIWLNFERILSEICLTFCFVKFKMRFPQSNIIFAISDLRNDWSNWCEIKRKWINWMLRWLKYLWPWLLLWIFEVKLYLGDGRTDCHGTKGTGVDWMPWCETQTKYVNWMLRWLGYLRPWILTLNFQGQIVSLGMGGPIVMEQNAWELKSIQCADVKHKGNMSSGCCANWGTYDLDLVASIFKVEIYFENGIWFAWDNREINQ